MATTFKPVYAAHAALTWTSLASLTNGSYGSCTVVDNTSNLYEDALVMGRIVTGSSGTTATGTCTIYAYAETDGTHYTDSVAGADATVTPTAPPNLIPIGIVNCVANSTTYDWGP